MSDFHDQGWNSKTFGLFPMDDFLFPGHTTIRWLSLVIRMIRTVSFLPLNRIYAPIRQRLSIILPFWMKVHTI